jgi:hypothetical protein
MTLLKFGIISLFAVSPIISGKSFLHAFKGPLISAKISPYSVLMSGIMSHTLMSLLGSFSWRSRLIKYPLLFALKTFSPLIISGLSKVKIMLKPGFIGAKRVLNNLLILKRHLIFRFGIFS